MQAESPLPADSGIEAQPSIATVTSGAVSMPQPAFYGTIGLGKWRDSRPAGGGLAGCVHDNPDRFGSWILARRVGMG